MTREIPQILWGYVKEKSTGITHIAPTIEGRFMRGHVLSEKCNCSPKIESSAHVVIVIHNIVH